MSESCDLNESMALRRELDTMRDELKGMQELLKSMNRGNALNSNTGVPSILKRTATTGHISMANNYTGNTTGTLSRHHSLNSHGSRLNGPRNNFPGPERTGSIISDSKNLILKVTESDVNDENHNSDSCHPSKIMKAVVCITATCMNHYSYSQPWAPNNGESEQSGTGFLLKVKKPGNSDSNDSDSESKTLIVTNAHVVEQASYVEVLRAGDDRPFVAHVVHTFHDLDLAILGIGNCGNDAENIDEDDDALANPQSPSKCEETEVLRTLSKSQTSQSNTDSIKSHKSQNSKDESSDFFHPSYTTPLDLSPSIPHIGDPVTIFGFPVGGTEMSLTRGVVSRLELSHLTHNWNNITGQMNSSMCLTVDTDCSVASGNSGGPVLDGRNGKVIGVVHENLEGKDGGFFISCEILRKVMEWWCWEREEDSETNTNPNNENEISFRPLATTKHHSTWRYPSLGLKTNISLQSSVLCEYLDITDSKSVSGVLIEAVADFSPLACKNGLRVYDILSKVNGYKISNNGTVEFRKGERTTWSYAYSNCRVGEWIEIEYYRSNKNINKTSDHSESKLESDAIHSDSDPRPNYGPPPFCDFQILHSTPSQDNKGTFFTAKLYLSTVADDLSYFSSPLHDLYPQYVLRAGLVFQPTNHFLEYTEFESKFNTLLGNQSNKSYYYGFRSKDLPEAIVLTKTFKTALLQGVELGVLCTKLVGQVLYKINGKRIMRGLRDVVDGFDNESEDKYIVLEFLNGSTLVLKREDVAKSERDILKKLAIKKENTQYIL